MNPYSRLVPRLNGREIEGRFSSYLDLVKKGVAGFIIFGGEVETVKAKVQELQDVAPRPLIVASDLEQGLGQQITGGTVFPPAMAIASALKGSPAEEVSAMLERVYGAFAREAGYAGINTILAPVLDINTNPDNPIIATRAFGEDSDTVSSFGCTMVRVLQKEGIVACGKHFPGHGDTEADSHLSLPVVRKDLGALEGNEFIPFAKAVAEGVGMMMLGHLSVPALDSSAIPASLSARVVSYLRNRLGFRGTILTDAMNMGGIGRYTENQASLMALSSGVDIILHPSEPDEVAAYLVRQGYGSKHGLPFPGHPPVRLPLKEMGAKKLSAMPDFAGNQRLSDRLAGMAITVEGNPGTEITKPFLIILSEDGAEKGEHFVNALEERYVGLPRRSLSPGEDMPWSAIPKDHDLIVSVFSQVRAWKGQTALWVKKAAEALDGTAKVFVSFGNPYVLRNVRRASRVFAYWDSRSAQEAAARRLALRPLSPFSA